MQAYNQLHLLYTTYILYIYTHTPVSFTQSENIAASDYYSSDKVLTLLPNSKMPYTHCQRLWLYNCICKHCEYDSDKSISILSHIRNSTFRRCSDMTYRACACEVGALLGFGFVVFRITQNILKTARKASMQESCEKIYRTGSYLKNFIRNKGISCWTLVPFPLVFILLLFFCMVLRFGLSVSGNRTTYLVHGKLPHSNNEMNIRTCSYIYGRIVICVLVVRLKHMRMHYSRSSHISTIGEFERIHFENFSAGPGCNPYTIDYGHVAMVNESTC